MAVTIDQTHHDALRLRYIGEPFTGSSLTGYGLDAFGGFSLPSITVDEPAPQHLIAETLPTPIAIAPRSLWPGNTSDSSIARSADDCELTSDAQATISALARIQELSMLPPDWDREGANPPTGRAVAAACHLIVSVHQQRLEMGKRNGVPATSSPLSDGGVQVEWEGRTCRIDVQFNEDGAYGYLKRCDSGSTVKYEESDSESVETILNLIHQTLDS